VDDLDESRAEELLRDIISEEEGRNLSVEQIQRHVAEEFDIRFVDMSSRRRPQHIAFPRQVAMYLVRELLKTPLKEIGRSFGGRDHGTVIHACRSIESKLREEEDFRHRCNRIRSELDRLGA
jgi:chromosomal replication initiator protein